MNRAIILAFDFLSSMAYRDITKDAKEFAEKANHYIERMKKAGGDKEIIESFASYCYERYAYLKEE